MLLTRCLSQQLTVESRRAWFAATIRAADKACSACVTTTHLKKTAQTPSSQAAHTVATEAAAAPATSQRETQEIGEATEWKQWQQPSEPTRDWDRSQDKSRLLAFYSDQYRLVLPEGHRYPMGKYEAAHRQLRDDVSIRHLINFQPAPLTSAEELALAHDPNYVRRCFDMRLDDKEQRAIGLPWSPQLKTYSRGSAGGGLAATRAVLQYGLPVAASIAGGTHHAFADRGEGFCIFNDIAISAAAAMQEHGLTRVLIIDLDVHQGNGTAAIFEGDPRVTTFDMHAAKNYPWNTKRKCTYDVPLPDAMEDDAYMQVLESWLPRLWEEHDPQLVIFQAGIDALKGDSYGRLALSRQGLLRRNNAVYSACFAAATPLVIVMGGGYSRPMDASVTAHADVFRSAALRAAALQATARE